MSSTARLFVATHEFYPHRGGIAVYAAEMAMAAAALGYDVEVWAPALPNGCGERAWPFPVRRLPISNTHSLRNQWRMARAIRNECRNFNDAILYVPEPGPLLSMQLLQLLGILPPCRLMLTLHGSEILKLAMRPLARWSTGRILERAEHVGVVSQHARTLLETFFPRTAVKTVLTHGALRTDLSTPAPNSRPAADGRKIVILTVARLHPRKGQLHLLRALQALSPELKSRVEYWLVGAHSKGGYEQTLRAAAERADLPVKFLGDIPDGELGNIYAQADIFAMTSIAHKLSVEGFGLVYLEAGSHGLPIVAHAIGGVPEAVIENETGLLVPPDDSAALTLALARLIGDPALRKRLGDAGRARAHRHTWRDNALMLFGQPGSVRAN
jgi:phosphatidyl-myo-inositol dimannoside synthase